MLSEEGVVQRFLRATEIDTRMLGMVAALLVIWAGFDIYSGILRPGEGLFGGSFLTPRNIWILLVQTSSIAVMTTGMVLIIVMRQIDLSVGSMLSMIAVSLGDAAGLQAWARCLESATRRSGSSPSLLRHRHRRGRSAASTALLIAYASIPSFIVTLGGLIAYSGAAWWVIRGETVAPMDKTFALIGGNGPLASIGPEASWALAIVACVGIVAAILSGRRQRRRFKFPLRPIWAECVIGGVGSAGRAAGDVGRELLSVGPEGHRELRQRQQYPHSAWS